MKYRLDIDKKYQEMEIHICNSEKNEEVLEILERVKQAIDTRLMAYDEDKVIVLMPEQVVRIYSSSQKVFAATEAGQYRLKERLYELEEKLDGDRFIRISNSEIVNLRKIIKLDTSITGTIKMYLRGNMETFVSRRYVARIKKALGI